MVRHNRCPLAAREAVHCSARWVSASTCSYAHWEPGVKDCIAEQSSHNGHREVAVHHTVSSCQRDITCQRGRQGIHTLTCRFLHCTQPLRDFLCVRLCLSPLTRLSASIMTGRSYPAYRPAAPWRILHDARGDIRRRRYARQVLMDVPDLS